MESTIDMTEHTAEYFYYRQTIFRNFWQSQVVLIILLTCGNDSASCFLIFEILLNLVKQVLPWLVWLSGLGAGLRTKVSLVRFPVRAHAWVAGQVPSRGCVRGNHMLMFPSLSFSLPLSLKINNIFLKNLKNECLTNFSNPVRMGTSPIHSSGTNLQALYRLLNYTCALEFKHTDDHEGESEAISFV